MTRMELMSVRLGIDVRTFVELIGEVPNAKAPRPLQGERGWGEGGLIKRHTETRTHAKRLRRQLTPAERKLWRILRANRIGTKFQKQVVLPLYIADFAARSERLVIEVDGDTHGDREVYEAARTAALAKMGYRVI